MQTSPTTEQLEKSIDVHQRLLKVARAIEEFEKLRDPLATDDCEVSLKILVKNQTKMKALEAGEGQDEFSAGMENAAKRSNPLKAMMDFVGKMGAITEHRCDLPLGASLEFVETVLSLLYMERQRLDHELAIINSPEPVGHGASDSNPS